MAVIPSRRPDPIQREYEKEGYKPRIIAGLSPNETIQALRHTLREGFKVSLIQCRGHGLPEQIFCPARKKSQEYIMYSCDFKRWNTPSVNVIQPGGTAADKTCPSYYSVIFQVFSYPRSFCCRIRRSCFFSDLRDTGRLFYGNFYIPVYGFR